MKTIIRLLLATAFMLLIYPVPMLVGSIPWMKAAMNGRGIGTGTSGMLLACAITLIVTSLSIFICYLLVWLSCKYLEKKPSLILNLQLNRWFFGMIIIAFIILALVTGILQLLGIHGEPMSLSGSTWWMMFIMSVASGFLMQGIPEELIWHGWLIPSLGGTKAAIILSAGVFGALHLISNGGQQNLIEYVIYITMPLGFGFAAGMVRAATNSTWAAIGVHGGFHLSALLGLFLPVENSPAQWVLIGTCWAIVGVLFARFYPSPLIHLTGVITQVNKGEYSRINTTLKSLYPAHMNPNEKNEGTFITVMWSIN